MERKLEELVRDGLLWPRASRTQPEWRVPPSDHQEPADIEATEALDGAGTSVALGGDQAEASAGWPDITELALVRAEEELPCWGRSTLEFKDASNPSAEPFFALDNKDEVHH
jgi:hypothetical protein